MTSRGTEVRRRLDADPASEGTPAGRKTGPLLGLPRPFRYQRRHLRGIPAHQHRTASVTIASISAAGVTSKDGFQACAPSVRDARAAEFEQLRGARISIRMSLPPLANTCRSSAQRPTMNLTPWKRASTAESVGADLVGGRAVGSGDAVGTDHDQPMSPCFVRCAVRPRRSASPGCRPAAPASRQPLCPLQQPARCLVGASSRP